MSMQTLGLKCKLTTPMFMYGADGKIPELRPSEFKGMMRFWWRAIRAEDNVEKLKEEEIEIFGGTEKGKSKLTIRILTRLNESDKIDYQPLPHHQNSNCPIDSLKWCNKAFKIKAIKPGKEIEIVFLATQMGFNMNSLVYLSFILGGFGKRSRRGFGSLEIIDPKMSIEKLDNILGFLNDISNGKYQISNSQILNNAKSIINKNSTKSPYPWIKEIIISNKQFNNYDEILKFIGHASHKHSNPSLGNANPRMASPVYVSVVKINDKLRPIITLLNSRFPDRYSGCNFDKQKDFIKGLV